MNLGPIQLAPLLKERVWGGTSIERWLGPASKQSARTTAPARDGTTSDGAPYPITQVPIGEAWMLADLPESIPGGSSLILSGEFAGETLTYLRQRAASELLGRAKPAAHGGFPLLVKLLDAAQDLSVQVHPDAAYSRRHPETHMKSEAWLVLEAQPRARLLRGINPNLSAAEFAQHVRGDSNLPPSQSRVPADLLSVPARVGDCHWLPSGLCHALGAGTLVAEVQTPSDTTFRIYDWGRGDPRRPLHIEEALECCLIGSAQNLGNSGLTAPITAVSAAIGQSGVTVRSLVAVEQFECDLITLAAGAKISGNPRGLPESWLCLSGSGSMGEIAVTRGGSILIPASCDGFCLSAIEPITALRTRARA